MGRISIRQATVNDLGNIKGLIEFYSAQESLLPKSRAELFVMLPNIIVAEYSGQFAGNVAFKIGEDEKAEIISWVVDKRYHCHGIGSMLITSVMERIEDLGIKIAYALTLPPRVNTFLKHGFKEVSKDTLPVKIWDDCIRCPRNIAVPGSVDCPELAFLKSW